MKPLELTIYPRVTRKMPESIRDDAGWNAYYDGLEGQRRQYLRQQAKRLTEPELAAEYWRHEGDYRMLTDGYQIESFSMTDHGMPPWATETLERDRVNTLHRFATTPHYFEETA